MKMTRTHVFIAMSLIMLVGFLTIGFFVFPVGIPLCGIIGLIYALRHREKLFALCSAAALFVGIGAIVYTLLLITYMR